MKTLLLMSTCWHLLSPAAVFGQEAPSLVAEMSPDIAAAFEAISFRSRTMSNRSPVDVCTLRPLLLPKASLPRIVKRGLESLLTAPDFTACHEKDVATVVGVVRVDSVRLGDASGSVWLSVISGADTVRERYFVTASRLGRWLWHTDSLTIRPEYGVRFDRRTGTGPAPALHRNE